MSQPLVLSPHPDSRWVSIVLEKFSYRTSRAGGKNAWTHRFGHANELNLTLREVKSVDMQGIHSGRMFMQVSLGEEVLETQDLANLVALYKQYAPLTGFSSENRVQIVQRDSICLAMSYPRDEVFTHSIQFKFFTETDFHRVEGILKTLGFSIRESAPPQRIGTLSVPPLPISSPALSMLSATSVGTSLTAASSVSRPLSALRSSPGVAILPPRQGAVSSACKLPKASAAFEATSNSIGSVVPVLRLSQSNSMVSTIIPHPRTALSTDSTLPQQQNISRHASLYASQIETDAQRQNQSQHDLLSMTMTKNPLTVSGPSFTHLTMQDSQTSRAEIHSNSISPFFTKSPSDEVVGPTFISDIVASASNLENSLSLTSAGCRPSSVPVSGIGIQDLYIPPRRELPFSTTISAGNPRLSPIAPISPLPKPTPVAKASHISNTPILPPKKPITAAPKPTKDRVAQRRTATMRTPECKSALEGKSVNESRNSKILPPQKQDSPLAPKSISARPKSTGSVLESKATVPRKRPASTRPTTTAKRSKMVDSSTQTDVIEADAFLAQPIVKSIVDGGITETISKDYQQSIDEFLANAENRSAPRHLSNTTEFQNASQEQRDILLNDFICQNLQNPDFIQLCKDMDNSWRRIGLGR